ncbi:MAG: hypothetical protein DDT19_02827 [Syntrophomonadaceae bacterium]|nr:hypothetical protein [Bacillota bacterium]
MRDLLSLNNEQKINALKEFYAHLTDDELKARLSVAGFEIVEDVPGQFLIDEELDLDALIQMVRHNFSIDGDLMEVNNCY